MLFRERSEGQSLTDPRVSLKLAGVRESTGLLTSRGGFFSTRSRQPASGWNDDDDDDDDERAQQTTLKVVCGLSRTRALCRSESPRECAPEGERVPPALSPLPPILSRPPSLPAVREPSPSSLSPLYPVSTARHILPPFRPSSFTPPLTPSPSIRSPAVLPEVRWSTILPLIRRYFEQPQDMS